MGEVANIREFLEKNTKFNEHSVLLLLLLQFTFLYINTQGREEVGGVGLHIHQFYGKVKLLAINEKTNLSDV